MRKIVITLLTVLLFIVGCGKEDKYIVEEIDLQIDGVSEHTFVFASDLHIVMQSDEVDEVKTAEVDGRVAYSMGEDGTQAKDLWPELVNKINSLKPDAVLLGGDMTDFSSKANMDVLKAGLDEIKAPYMYVRADHDYASWFTDYDDNHGKSLQNEVNEIKDIYEMEFDDLIIVGIDNNTSNVSEETVTAFGEILKKEKPVIVMMHVPVKPEKDESLSVMSKEIFADRELIWGKDCYYYPDANTLALINMIKDENSPVQLLVCGHLHFTWDGEIAPGKRQHVFDAAFKKNIGVIRVHG